LTFISWSKNNSHKHFDTVIVIIYWANFRRTCGIGLFAFLFCFINQMVNNYKLCYTERNWDRSTWSQPFY